MSVLSLLTEEDKETFISYIKNFGNGSGCTDNYEQIKSIDSIASPDYLLRFWDIAKGQYLESIFGNQLIRKVPIEYTTPIEEIDFDGLYKTPFAEHYIKKCLNGMSERYWRDGYYSYLSDDELIKEYDEIGSMVNADCKYCNHLYSLLTHDDYAYDNIFSGSTFSITVGDKHPLKICSGMKWSKALGKITNYLGLDESEYEEFRQHHSLLINTKKLKGNLCLSIHPMDYITMSDATFDSCMSWINKGGYRRGTVEMMNSSSVVVAYLESKDNTLSWDDYWDYDSKHSWNLKKWRTLLIAEPGFVCSVKAYPYRNDELAIKAVEILSEMYDEEFNSRIYDFDAGYFQIPEGMDHEGDKIEFTTDTMYCDMGLTHHFIKFSGRPICFSNGYYICNYSGASECMLCGETHYSFGDDSCVFCCDCMNVWNDDDEEYCYCNDCGQRMYVDDANWLHDDPYCDRCFHEHANYCVCCDSYVYKEDSSPIVITYKGINNFSKISRDTQEEMRNSSYGEHCICNNCLYDLKRLKGGEVNPWNTEESFKELFAVPVDNIDIVWVGERKWQGAIKIETNDYPKLVDSMGSVIYDNYNLNNITDYMAAFNKFLRDEDAEPISYDEIKEILKVDKAAAKEAVA